MYLNREKPGSMRICKELGFSLFYVDFRHISSQNLSFAKKYISVKNCSFQQFSMTYARSLESKTMVNGPSLIKDIFISAPKIPDSTTGISFLHS